MALRQDYYHSYAAKRGSGGGGAAPPPPGQRSWRAVRCTYFAVGAGGYAVGLTCANVAVAAMQMGQPALMYLVPCILLPLCATAAWRGELRSWWGATVPLDDDDGGGDGSDGAVEWEPLTPAHARSDGASRGSAAAMGGGSGGSHPDWSNEATIAELPPAR